MQPSPSMMDRQTPISAHEAALNAELTRLPNNVVMNIKQDLGILDKEPHSLTMDEKVISHSFEASHFLVDVNF